LARSRIEQGDAPPFVPAVVEMANTAASLNFDAANNAALARSHSIDLDIEGSSVWVWPGADATMVAAIIGALKAAK
jgi:hypothetical protein